MADAIEARRTALGLTLGDFAKRSGLTRQGLDPVRRGLHRQYEDRTLFGIARALEWPSDWYARIQRGESPDDADTSPARPSLDDELRDVVTQAVEDTGLLEAIHMLTDEVRQLRSESQSRRAALDDGNG